MKDLKRTTTGDIDLSSGDVVWADASQHHARDIIKARKGDYKLSPGVGVGLDDYLDDDPNPNALLQAINQQLTADGMTVNKLEMVNGKLEIDANY